MHMTRLTTDMALRDMSQMYISPNRSASTMATLAVISVDIQGSCSNNKVTTNTPAVVVVVIVVD